MKLGRRPEKNRQGAGSESIPVIGKTGDRMGGFKNGHAVVLVQKRDDSGILLKPGISEGEV